MKNFARVLKGYSVTLNWLWRNLVVSVEPANGGIKKEGELCFNWYSDNLHFHRSRLRTVRMSNLERANRDIHPFYVSLKHLNFKLYLKSSFTKRYKSQIKKKKFLISFCCMVNFVTALSTSHVKFLNCLVYHVLENPVPHANQWKV